MVNFNPVTVNSIKKTLAAICKKEQREVSADSLVKELHYNKDSIDQDVTYKSKSNFKVVEGKGDLKETDEVFLFRSRGGREDEFALFESIMRKRIIPPISADLVLNQAPEYISWLLSVKSNYQFERKKDSIVFESTM
ncbi:hypothetical protein MTR67_013084 [Solanum verrucosum]|uniref:Uncharacterized protein n=1 Tax=Solanum verrucosum TaxID=315347 RepID=A0AAF0QGW5_SOLVR|nr:hypothetical protein MTR67_013084 [Solanum verrucosum]